MALVSWGASLAATVVSTYALDATAAATGAVLVATGWCAGLDTPVLGALLVVSYAAWGLGLRVNLGANWALLTATGTSTNILSKAAYDLTRRRSTGTRIPRLAAALGYLGTELAKEIPYYAGALGAAAATDAVTSNGALVFLTGANLGAAAYEYGLARATRVVIRRVRSRAAGAAESRPDPADSPSRSRPAESAAG
jgi:hypothetical protein